MSEIDLFSIGRCQEQVTRENLEASIATSILINSHYRRTYVAFVVLLLYLSSRRGYVDRIYEQIEYLIESVAHR